MIQTLILLIVISILYIVQRKSSSKPVLSVTPELKEVKDFNIDEFNTWFKTEFTGYDGRQGAPGIFLRTDKLSSFWVQIYLKEIGQDIDFDNVSKHYLIIRKDWYEKIRFRDAFNAS